MFAPSKLDIDPPFDPYCLLASPDEEFPSPFSDFELDSPFTPVSPLSPTDALTRSDSISSYQSTSTTSTQDTNVHVTEPIVSNFADHLYQHEQSLYDGYALPQSCHPSLTDNSSMNTNNDNIRVKMEPVEMNAVSVPTTLPPLPPLSTSDPAPVTRTRRTRQSHRKHQHQHHNHASSTIIPLPRTISTQVDVQLIEETKWNSAPTWKRYSMIHGGNVFDWCVPRSCLAQLVGASQNNRQRALQYQRSPTLIAPEFQRRIKVGTIHPTTQKTNMVTSEWVIKILQFRKTDPRTSIQIQHVASNFVHELVQRGFA